jgi:hypothetical protein
MLLTGEIPMKITLFQHAILGVPAALIAVFSLAVSAQANTRPRHFNANAAAIKQGCGGGTYLGTNKDGFYGCISKNGNAVTTCKKGKCVTDHVN